MIEHHPQEGRPRPFLSRDVPVWQQLVLASLLTTLITHSYTLYGRFVTVEKNQQDCAKSTGKP